MFITTTTKNRVPLFADPAKALEAVEAIYRVQAWKPFLLFAFVVMPDHCHFLLNVPEGGTISSVMHTYKRAVTFSLDQGPIWQSRFHIVFPKNSSQIIHYIHMNPVVAKLAERQEDYLWSSGSGKWDVTPLEIWFE